MYDKNIELKSLFQKVIEKLKDSLKSLASTTFLELLFFWNINFV